MAHDNARVFKNGLLGFVNRVVKPKVVGAMQLTALEVEAFRDEVFIPIYTGNLMDSTGAAIYTDGTLARFIPPKTATEPQEVGLYNYVWGVDALNDAINEASSEYKSGYWLVVFSTMPYAERINETGSPIGRGEGYWYDLTAKVQESLENQLKAKGLI